MYNSSDDWNSQDKLYEIALNFAKYLIRSRNLKFIQAEELVDAAFTKLDQVQKYGKVIRNKQKFICHTILKSAECPVNKQRFIIVRRIKGNRKAFGIFKYHLSHSIRPFIHRPEPISAVAWLRYHDKLAPDEIANQLGLPDKAVSRMIGEIVIYLHNYQNDTTKPTIWPEPFFLPDPPELDNKSLPEHPTLEDPETFAWQLNANYLLPKPQDTIMQLKFQGVSIETISNMLDMSTYSVINQISDAKVCLRALLKKAVRRDC